MDKQIETKLQGAIKELSNSFLRVEAERDLQKEIIANISEETEIEKKHIRKMARVYHKQNYQEETQNHEEFTDLYEQIFMKSDFDVDTE